MKVNRGGKHMRRSTRGGGGGGEVLTQNDQVYLVEKNDDNETREVFDVENQAEIEEEQFGEEEEQEENEQEDEEGEVEEEIVQDERPKLDEGYYEIEAIRRKRVRKGQLQYHVKWRGWPETANTWEPLENLQSCSDIIEAFEDSLRSGKSSRKRKRKYGGPHSSLKKKQSRTTNADVDGQSLPSSPLFNTNLSDHPTPTGSTGSGHEVENNGDTSNVKTSKQASDANGSKQIDGMKKATEDDQKLNELKGTVSPNEVNGEKLSVNFQEDKVSEGNGPTNGFANVDCVEPIQSGRRVGSRRRKSGSVKRFTQELAAAEKAVAQDSPSTIVGCGGTAEQLATGNSIQEKKIDTSGNASAIVKILKPIDFSASESGNIQDVLVTFMALRSDGKEVMVDNKFLKANDPLLLINFYEQHLRHNTQ